MKLEVSCPWCGAEATLKGASQAPWRFRIPCELCSREMVVTWDGALSVSRAADGAIDHSEDATRPVKLPRMG